MSTKPVRLRSSCHNCSFSKLKCSQDKPICLRCAKRGFCCEYVVAKQGGRKPNNPPVTAHHNPHLSDNGPRIATPPSALTDANAYGLFTPNMNWETISPSISDNRALQKLSSDQGTAMPTASPVSLMVHDLFTPSDSAFPFSASSYLQLDSHPDSTWSTPWLAADMTNLNDMDPFKTPETMPLCVDSSNTAIDNGNDNRMDDDIGHTSRILMPTNAAVANAALGLFAVSIPKDCMVPDINAAKPYPEGSCQTARSPPYSCLIKALRSLEDFVSTTSDCTEPKELPSVSSSAQQTLTKNRLALESMGTMLNCICSNDAYLLAVIPIVLSKVLDVYTALAQTRTPHSGATASSGSASHASTSQMEFGEAALSRDLNFAGDLDRDSRRTESARIIAQLVLRELYLVRRVIEQLSAKLKSKSFRTSDSDEMEGENASLFSETLQEQIACALIARVKGLSLDIISYLKGL